MLKKVLSSVGVIFSFFLFAACEVGLGEKVDVIAPVLEIGTPEDGSVIMNTFTMTGSAGDDSFVALININVTSTTTGATVANYTGGMDIFRSAWSCTVNNRHVAEDGTVSYDIPDGEYTFTVTATDKVGRQTSKSRMYKIDNTAPIVVIKRPDTDDSFGKTIRVTGDIADANTLSSLYFTAYKKNSEGILEKIDTVRHANISGVGLDLIIAKNMTIRLLNLKRGLQSCITSFMTRVMLVRIRQKYIVLLRLPILRRNMVLLPVLQKAAVAELTAKAALRLWETFLPAIISMIRFIIKYILKVRMTALSLLMQILFLLLTALIQSQITLRK